jgi:hypothetical protein
MLPVGLAWPGAFAGLVVVNEVLLLVAWDQERLRRNGWIHTAVRWY